MIVGIQDPDDGLSFKKRNLTVLTNLYVPSMQILQSYLKSLNKYKLKCIYVFVLTVNVCVVFGLNSEVKEVERSFNLNPLSSAAALDILNLADILCVGP